MDAILRRAALIAVAALAACHTPGPPADPGSDDALLTQPGIAISTNLDASTSGDPYTIVGRPLVEGYALRVTVRYAGGCARHEFALFASHVFMESYPVQSAIAIRHRANGDACEALLTRELRFDLTALRDAYWRAYGNRAGTIILRLRGYAEGIPYSF